MVYKYPSPEYGENWNRRRFAIFKAYNYTCQICGRYAKGNMCLHHINPIKVSHDNRGSNLLPICNQCHEMIHQEYINRKRRFELDELH